MVNLTEKEGNFIGYEEFIPFLIKYNIKCNLYTKDKYYKGREWITLNDKNDIEEITLWYKQGSYQRLTGHYTALIRNNYTPKNFKAKLLNIINNKISKPQTKTQVNIMVWNIRSINPSGQMYKRGYLIQTLYEENIQIALLQETMLQEKNKLYMKGYKIYRSDATINRRGVAILISEQLDCKPYIILKDPYGRYLQVKLRNEQTNQEIIISTAYVEPNEEDNPSIIPQEIWDCPFFAGDLNKMTTNLTKINNVYHIKGLGKLKEKITVPNIVSDHQILIFENTIPMPANPQYEEIQIQDKNKINSNNQQILQITLDDNYQPRFQSITKQIKIKKHQIRFNNINYIQDYEQIKNAEKEKFKKLKQKKIKELIQLLETNNLGREPQQKLTSLMQIHSKIKWWKSQNQNEKINILNESKQLYNHKQTKPTNPKLIAQNLISILDKIINDNATKLIESPKIPKSRARDLNGFSQREIIHLIKAQNLYDTALRAKYLIQRVIENLTSEIFIHNTCKILLKQKKETIENSKDLRPISIMPAIIMVVDKIANQYLQPHIQKIPFINQHGARKG